MRAALRQCLLFLGVLLVGNLCAEPLPTLDGYHGIWYSNQASKDQYKYKYSGGLGTYPQQHTPIAVYSAEANKTFFSLGLIDPPGKSLLHGIGFFDHGSGKISRPRVLLDKKTGDAHDNPTISMDSDGHIWIFSNSHGTGRPSYIHRSTKSNDIDEFEKVLETNFSYGQPWHLADHGFVFLHTKYGGGRRLHWMTSSDGRKWSEPTLLARVAQGHYQVSWSDGKRIATAFNYHPDPVGLNARTNLYFLQTEDGGKSWKTISGEAIQPPIQEADHMSLVREYQSKEMLVYLKDIAFDVRGNPLVLYLTSRSYRSGPHSEPRTWHIAQWTGKQWVVRNFSTSDHNYDYGSLYAEEDGAWRIIAPTNPGPQAWGTGGEMVMWLSRNQGRSWKRVKELTPNSRFNHTYARKPVNAHPDFYALWADGDAFGRSESSIYFCTRDGNVFRFPTGMTDDMVNPSPFAE